MYYKHFFIVTYKAGVLLLSFPFSKKRLLQYYVTMEVGWKTDNNLRHCGGGEGFKENKFTLLLLPEYQHSHDNHKHQQCQLFVAASQRHRKGLEARDVPCQLENPKQWTIVYKSLEEMHYLRILIIRKICAMVLISLSYFGSLRAPGPLEQLFENTCLLKIALPFHPMMSLKMLSWRWPKTWSREGFPEDQLYSWHPSQTYTKKVQIYK